MAVQDRHVDCGDRAVQRGLPAHSRADRVWQAALRARLRAGRSIGRFGLGGIGGNQPAVCNRPGVHENLYALCFRRYRPHVSSRRRFETEPPGVSRRGLPDLRCEVLQPGSIAGETGWRRPGGRQRIAESACQRDLFLPIQLTWEDPDEQPARLEGLYKTLPMLCRILCGTLRPAAPAIMTAWSTYQETFYLKEEA